MIVVKTVDGGHLNPGKSIVLQPDRVPQYLVVDKNAPTNNLPSPVAAVGRNIDSVIEEEEKEIVESKEPQKIKITVDKKEQFVADQSR